MFEIKITGPGKVSLSGRFDAAQAEHADAAFRRVEESCLVDCTDLDYISSAGIGVIIATYKRLYDMGADLRLVNLNDRIKQVFRYAGLDKIFDLQ
jgi:anti-sigma B factor antagonist